MVHGPANPIKIRKPRNQGESRDFICGVEVYITDLAVLGIRKSRLGMQAFW
jgi:hypothetical protein